MEQIEAYVQAARNLLGGWVGTVVTAVVIVVITALIAKAVSKFLRRILRRDETPLPSSSIFLNIARGVIWIIGGSIVLDSCFGVDVSALVTALGIGGIAVSLGFQDTISNFFGGLQLTLMRIVEPGDNIRVGSDSGVVKDVTWRHTTIRSQTGEKIVIPNSVLSKTSFTKLAPAETFSVPFVASCEPHELDQAGKKIKETAEAAAASVGEVDGEAIVRFGEVTEFGFRGKVIVKMKDAADTLNAGDAIVRAIAPLVR